MVFSTIALPRSRVRHAVAQLLRFTWLELVSCAFAAVIFVGLAASQLIWARWSPPIARYDALLAYVIVAQAAFLVLRLETWRELAVICAFHLVGLALEVVKVRVGSWTYPDAGTLRLGGVPLFSGFMYAAVGSYICQAFRRFDLRVTNFRWVPTSLLAIAAYANFFTHHYLPDVRVLVAIGFLIALWDARVYFTVGRDRYWMPLSASFILIGTFLWVAENAGTLLGAWRYPNQTDVWELVHVGKLGSWALLVSLSFVLVAAIKAQEGRFYGDAEPRVHRRDRLSA